MVISLCSTASTSNPKNKIKMKTSTENISGETILFIVRLECNVCPQSIDSPYLLHPKTN